MLTGKNKRNFEKWIMKSMNDTSYPSAYKSYIDWFYDLPISMQFGVLQDYADSIGYDINITKGSVEGYFWNIQDKYGFDEGQYPTRDEARKAVIKAFDEIVNATLRVNKQKY
jgi:hypothetical protein